MKEKIKDITKNIDDILPKVRKGLEKYLCIQDMLYIGNISRHRLFQKRFNGFYRIRRGKEWQRVFYELLEFYKDKKINFEDILYKLYKKTGRVEAAFASKLVATINPEMPVIDRVVLNNLKYRLPRGGSISNQIRIKKTNELYRTLIRDFKECLQSAAGKNLVKRFKKEYPRVKITKVKMLDFVLWQSRPEN